MLAHGGDVEPEARAAEDEPGGDDEKRRDPDEDRKLAKMPTTPVWCAPWIGWGSPWVAWIAPGEPKIFSSANEVAPTPARLSPMPAMIGFARNGTIVTQKSAPTTVQTAIAAKTPAHGLSALIVTATDVNAPMIIRPSRPR